MSKVFPAVKLMLAAAASLRTLTLATAVAGVLTPIVARVVGAPVTVAEVTGWLVVIGGACATLEQLEAVEAARHPVPPVVPPVPPVVPPVVPPPAK